MNTLYLSLVSYGLLLVTLAKLPERFWDHLLSLKAKGSNFLARKKRGVPYIGEIYLGEGLLLGLQEAESKLALGTRIMPAELQRFKFYTDLLEQLFESHRKLGIGIKKIIPEIRRSLARDLQFERKIFDEILGGLLQFTVIASTTWGFVFLSSILVDIAPGKPVLLLMVLLQTMGVFIFFKGLAIVKNRTFKDFSEAIKEMYLFTNFIEIGLPLNEILQRSGILQGSLMESKQFVQEGMRAKKLIERLKETGISPRDEAQEIIEALWHTQEENFGKFTKKVQVMKFGILAFFFLPAYFLYLYSIFKFFMEQ